MSKYILIIVLIFTSSMILAQSPHGDNFNLDCTLCHSTDSWKVQPNQIQFDHSQIGFSLLGQHKSVDCQSCHKSLIFNNVAINCFDCHTDIHEGTVGFECERCHNNSSWIVDNIIEIHRQSRFPLLGKHETADCKLCHEAASNLIFEPINAECYDCHKSDYQSAQNPNHVTAGFSTTCEECHELSSAQWRLAAFAHNFFPLTGGHAISNCFECHETNTYKGLSNECIACHQDDYNITTNPSHTELQFPVECNECHTLNPGWKPASFELHNDIYPLVGAHAEIKNDCSKCHSEGYVDTPNQCYDCHTDEYSSTTDPPHQSLNFDHDCEVCHTNNSWKPSTFNHDVQYFPIYSGEHKGEWDNCSDCHVDVNDYSHFECIDCHEHNKSSMDSEHREVNGYIYVSSACFNCHPNGKGDLAFNHSTTNFPLQGSHIGVDCSECHKDNTQTPSTNCAVCHKNAIENSVNPNHQRMGLTSECEQCHNSTAWIPSTFDHNTTGFQLAGKHADVSCDNCHESANTMPQTDCYFCHADQFLSAPNHQTQNYPKDCEMCHSTFSWQETSFDHAQTNFPLTGAHITTDCSMCHSEGYVNTPTNCFDCHNDKFSTAPNHVTQNFPQDCFMCHTTVNWQEITFDHSQTNFPLTGAHVNTDCSSCHTTGYTNTSTSCNDCHSNDYNTSANPNHITLGLSVNCEVCHSTNVNWEPAKFPDHNNYYMLLGAHAQLLNDCQSCHNGNYTNTPNTCYGCHQQNFNSTTDPNHQAAGFSSDCESCHSQNAWKPSTFDHDAQYFPIYSGEHRNEWNACSDCHNVASDFGIFTCISCHEHNQNEMDDEHRGVNGYRYESTACLDCHPDGDKAFAFNHAETNFRLQGEHANLSCQQCHKNSLGSLPTECISCHNLNYQKAVNPDHRGLNLSQDCSVCHTSNDWLPSTFDHQSTGYSLLGKHTLLTCNDCHNGSFVITDAQCINCHESSFAAAPDHLSKSYPHDCTLCHNNNLWSEPNFDHNATTFPLTGAHQQIDCESCHQSGYSGTPIQCESCHNNDYLQTSNPPHVSLNFEMNCINCHTTNSGWKPAAFPGHNQIFILDGAHAVISGNCDDCHGGNYTNTNPVCVSCHNDKYLSTSNPNHAAIGISDNCIECHNSSAWSPSTFNHDVTQFALTGKHQTTDCNQCHISSQAIVQLDCFNCHQSNYNAALDHLSKSFPTNCVMCHNTNDWLDVEFDHSTTAFPLTGKHLAAGCNSCHVTMFTGTSTICFDCHENDYNNSITPNHPAAGLSSECQSCHSTSSWMPSLFNHSSTGFELTGKHVEIQCGSCHVGTTENTPSSCNLCHNDVYVNTTNPDHDQIGLSIECQSCHTTANWVPSPFNHSTTDFPLLGKHASVSCSSCHTTSLPINNFGCLSCHQDNYNSAPQHISQNYPADCLMCHNMNGWDETSFDHGTTNFPLTGQHQSVTCSSCHSTGYAGITTLCADCHNDNYQDTNNPNHAQIGISTNCIDCHNTTSWIPSLFNHDNTNFALTGSHSAAACTSCHVTAQAPGTSCFGCHNSSYNNAPNHLAQSYPTTCEMCHNTNSWNETSFNHNSTNFPLAGAHINVECSTCHTVGYTGTSQICNDCHNNNYQNAINPDHVTLVLSTNCNECHSTNPDWQPTQFPDHNNTYPLIGAHAVIQNDCNACHGGNYTNTPDQCEGCHLQDFNSTTNPNHTTTGFPTDCETCHTQNAWIPSTFNHDVQYFPIYKGAHKEEWNVCSDCHTNAANFTVFECINCHEHNKTKMDDKHKEEPGYVYLSSACYDCHPDGKSDRVLLIESHINIPFKLIGGHADLECSQCHVDNKIRTVIKCINCHEHSLAKSKLAHRNVTGFQFSNEACVDCHPAGNKNSLID